MMPPAGTSPIRDGSVEPMACGCESAAGKTAVKPCKLAAASKVTGTSKMAATTSPKVTTASTPATSE
jgi:hypothetical protein